MLVDEIVLGEAALVAPIHSSEKSRLLQHPRGAAIEVDVGRKAVGEDLLETCHALALPAKLIVEADDFGDDARPKMKRRLCSGGDRLRGRRTDDGLALETREPARLDRQPSRELIVQFGAGNEDR